MKVLMIPGWVLTVAIGVLCFGVALAARAIGRLVR